MKRNVKFIGIAVAILMVLSACSFASVATNAINTVVKSSPSQAAAPKIISIAAPSQAQAASPTLAPISANTSVAGLETTVQQIYAQVNPSVVTINVTEQAAPTSRRNFGNPFGQGSQVSQALGSGFVWDKNGDIVTNNHVVSGATSIEVTFSDGLIAPATVVGTDVNSDLAVIKVNVAADHLQPVTLADSTQVKVGALAVAIGNPFGETGSLSVGFISGLGRNLDVASNSQTSTGSSYQIPDIIQTDAPINPGNSGGVLVDMQGQVIGVTAAIESAVNSNSGVGFAIPSVIVNRVAPSLIQSGHYDHPYLGISGSAMRPEFAQAMNLNADQRGVLVGDVASGGPAEKAGLQGGSQQVNVDGSPATVGGDIIVSVNGQTVNTFDDLMTYLERTASPGEKVTLGVLRGGKSMNIDVTLGVRPVSPLGVVDPTQNTSGLTNGA